MTVSMFKVGSTRPVVDDSNWDKEARETRCNTRPSRLGAEPLSAVEGR